MLDSIKAEFRRYKTPAEAGLAHIAYHVGQIVHVAHAFRGREWTYLSIPPGGIAAWNQRPTLPRSPER